MLPKFDPEISIYDNWKRADSLYSAWFHFSPEELKNQYRNSGGNEARSLTIRAMMQGEVRHAIAELGLIAFGIATDLRFDCEVKEIPPTYFESESSIIDWENSAIEGFGQKFQDVRICVAQHTIETGIVTSDRARPASAIGRQSHYSRAKIIFAELFLEHPDYQMLPASKLHSAFNSKFLDRFSTSDVKYAPVAERTLRDYLKKFRQELAETGRK